MSDNLQPAECQIYTDGACLGNPGPGGYGVILRAGPYRKELSGGFRHTTNNRMEMMAAIVALQNLRKSSKVTLYTDSRYLVDAIMKGWAQKWRANGWRRSAKAKALNPDLWAQLLKICELHQVAFVWVKGHAGHPENERCDQLAQLAAQQPNLPIDTTFEALVAQKTASLF